MRTKIICTIGPASDSDEITLAIIRAGMDVARLNFSHGTHADHARRIAVIRRAAEGAGKLVTIMGDLQGPKFRLGELPDEGISLSPNQNVVIAAQSSYDDGTVPFPHPDVIAKLQIGQRLLIDDGAVALVVTRQFDESSVQCTAVTSGLLTSHKGVSVPGLKIVISSITPKDREDLQFALEQGVDALALSFVRRAADVRELRSLIREAGGDQLVVSKIEKPEAIEDLNNIIRESDAIMVARGDLGVEGAPEDVPFYQKRIIRACLREGKPVITATQMLQSMIHEPQPTRAEASDVANAVVDGTDAVMLSGETAMGKYPVQATEAMARIAKRAEEFATEIPNWLQDALLEEMTDQPNRMYCTDAITLSAVRIADRIGAKAIVCASASGFTVRMVARHRPEISIICMTPSTRTQRYSAFMWGVTSVIAETRMTTTEHLFEEAAEAAVKLGCASAGDQIIVTAGVPLGSGSGHTNLIKVQEVR